MVIKMVKKKKEVTPFQKLSLKKSKTIRSYPGISLDMAENELPIFDIPVVPGKKYSELFFVGDLHIGSIGFAERQFLSYVNFIKKNPSRRVILMGDLVEVGDLSRYLPEQRESFKYQLQRCITYLEPIKDQILIILEGNHEERYAKEAKQAINLSRYIALELGIHKTVKLPGPQKGQLCIIKAGDQYYPIYVIHGSTGAIYQAATQLKRMAFRTKVPLVAHGHIHKYYTESYVFESVTQFDDKFYKAIYEQIWLTTGAFVKDLGYAEQKSYPLTKIGAPAGRFFRTYNAISIGFGRDLYQIGLDGKSVKELKKELGIGADEET